MLETLCEYLIHVSVLLPHISKHKTGDMVDFSDNFLKAFYFCTGSERHTILYNKFLNRFGFKKY